MPAPALFHIALACRDPLAAERFYTRHFAFRRVRVVNEGEEPVVFLRSGPVYLELFQARGEAPARPAEGAGPLAPGWRHIAFNVPDVDAALAELGSEVRLTLGPLDFSALIPGWRSAWVADPEGNILELTQGYRDE